MARRPSHAKRIPFSVCNSTGWSDLTIQKNGLKITIPAHKLNKQTGEIKKGPQALLGDLTEKNIVKLQEFGVIFETIA